MRIREVDRFDQTLTRRCWEIGRAADEQGRPWSGYWSWDAARAAFTASETSMERVLLAAFDGDSILGTAALSLPRLDNRHLATLEVYVDPPHQRRGVGTTLVETAIAAAAERDRTVVTAEVATPLGGAESPGLRLAHRLGFRTELVDEMKVADLDETQRLWGPILAETEASVAAYTLRSWWGRCPDDIVEGFCQIIGTFFDEAPTGELDVEPERWDVARLREKEERFARAGRHETTTLAIARDGQVVGMTEAMLSEHAPDRAFQGSTVVAPAHRGHGLGLRLKVTNYRRLRDAFPGCRSVLTGNADVNVAMNAVNERLGFRAVERMHEMQRRLEVPGAGSR